MDGMPVNRSGVAQVAMDAANAARRAAERADVEVRLLADLHDLEEVHALFNSIWHPDKNNPPVTVEQLRALTHAGNYLAGAYDGDVLVGACVGFFAAPVGVSMRSHVAGVAAKVRGRNVGFALKLDQRAWALRHGLAEVTWTFDPLLRRNAYFNLVKLGARVGDYLVDFYGEMGDAINSGQGSDRLLVVWEVASPAVIDACGGRLAEVPDAVVANAPLALTEGGSGRPRVVSGWRRDDAPIVRVQVPADVEGLRRTGPAAAREWRLAVRDVLGELVDNGAQVIGFSRAGWYVVEKART
jgi:predicted GNAT superfamily acetyltransferase